jgi:hypothetical protein
METDSGTPWGCLIYSVIFVVALSVTFLWDSKLKYAFEYGVNLSDVHKDPKPHDCDWSKAPIGDKECHYEVEVLQTKVREGQDQKTGKPIISYDDGSTWNWDSHG